MIPTESSPCPEDSSVMMSPPPNESPPPDEETNNSPYSLGSPLILNEQMARESIMVIPMDGERARRMFQEERDKFNITSVPTASTLIPMEKTTDPNEEEYISTIPQSNIWWHSLVAGFCAGTISRSLTAPLDRIKVLAQEGRIVSLQTSHPLNHTRAQSHKRRVSFSKLISHIHMDGGWISFWRGNGVNCLKAGPEIALLFYLRSTFIQLLRADQNEAEMHSVQRLPPHVINFASSAMAGAVAQCIVYPLETAKTRMAVSNTGEYRGLFDCLAQARRRNGVKDWYRGLTPNLIGIVPYRGLEIGSYYALENALRAHKRHKMLENNSPSNMEHAYTSDATSLSILEIVVLGSLSSVFAQTVTYPLNLVRTRLQTQGVNGRPSPYTGAIHCITTVIRVNGISGLFHGLSANYLKSVPASAITFVVVDRVQEFLQKQNHH